MTKVIMDTVSRMDDINVVRVACTVLMLFMTIKVDVTQVKLQFFQLGQIRVRPSNGR